MKKRSVIIAVLVIAVIAVMVIIEPEKMTVPLLRHHRPE